MASSRSPRPLTSNFSEAQLKQQWSGLAKLKKPGFSWDASSYQVSTRTEKPDLESLENHARAARPLIELAPTGFPSIVNLRNVFVQLHKEYNIFDSIDDRHVWKTATDASDKWRIVCKHVYNLKKAGASDSLAEYPQLQGLVGLIQLPKPKVPAAAESPGGGEPAPDAPGGIALEDVASMFPIADSDDELGPEDADEECYA
eukprot:1033760-Pyramimonas_sp.AAC.1